MATEPGIRDLNHAVIAGVVLLQTPDVGGALTWAGTGFFFQHETRVFLVTCRHVIVPDAEDPAGRMVAQTRTGPEFPMKPRQIDLKLQKNGRPLYRTFRDKSMDLTAVPIDAEDLAGSWVTPLTAESLPPDDIYLPYGSTVVLPGFPHGYYDEPNLLPIVRQGAVASLYRAPFRGTQRFLIEANLHPGMSGAPVFTRPDSYVYRYSQPFKFQGGPVSYFLGVHAEGLDKMGIQDVWYAQLLPALTSANPPSEGPLALA